VNIQYKCFHLNRKSHNVSKKIYIFKIIFGYLTIMNSKELLIIILASLLIVKLEGQVQIINIKGSYSEFFQLHPNKYQYDVLGSPYLNSQWMYGNLTLTNETNLESLFRYNIYNQQIEMIYNNDTLGVDLSSIKELNFSNKKFKYLQCIERDFNKDYLTPSFFEVLYEGHCQLLMKHYAEIENNSYSVNYMGGGGDGRDYFRLKSSYYYKKDPGEAAIKLNTHRKKIYELFSDKQQEIRQFIKTERINLHSSNDLIRLFKYYNGL
jgi:hypothetical protein